jgi:type II secretory ATPase GspE/PulE/Tfp pilus assembly ATPase PilB-like protein
MSGIPGASWRTKVFSGADAKTVLEHARAEELPTIGNVVPLPITQKAAERVVATGGDMVVAAKMTVEEALLKAGVKPHHIAIAQQRQRQTQEPLTEIMRGADYGFLTPEKTAKVNSNISGYEYFPPTQIHFIDGETLSNLCSNRQWALRKDGRAVPVKYDGSRLTIAIAESADRNEAQTTYTGIKHAYVIASERTINTIRRQFFSRSGEELNKAYLDLERANVAEEDNSTVVQDYLHRLMRHAAYSGASDISFSPMASAKGCVTRLKVDGRGQIPHFLSAHAAGKVIRYIVNDAGKAQALNQGPVDFSYDIKGEGFDDIKNRYRFRGVVIPRGTDDEASNSSLVMRLIDSASEVAEVENLGYDAKTSETLLELMNRAYGMVIVTGPTGSGKSTTLYALLQTIDPVDRWVNTLENPIEFRRGLWNQAQVKTSKNSTQEDEARYMQGLLRANLRAAPDALLYGEIRNAEIAKEAFKAAATGHLILSTMHTNNAIDSLSRLRDLELDMGQVAGTLLAILSQRLVPTLCACKEPDEDPEIHRSLRRYLGEPAEGETYKPFKPVGCANCNHSGYRDRAMVYELLSVNKRVASMIEQRASMEDFRKEAMPVKSTMLYRAVALVANGRTTLDVAKRLGELEDLL